MTLQTKHKTLQINFKITSNNKIVKRHEQATYGRRNVIGQEIYEKMFYLASNQEIINFKKLKHFCLPDQKTCFKRLISNDGAEVGNNIL